MEVKGYTIEPRADLPGSDLGGFAKQGWWERPPWSHRVDLITSEDPVLGPDGCFDYCFDPCPVLGSGKDLLTTVLVAVPE